MKLPILIVLALVVAACGSSSGGSGATVRTTAPGVTSTVAGTNDDSSTTTNLDDSATTLDDGSSTTVEPPPTTDPPEAVECEAPEGLEPYCEPFVLDQGDTQVIWDRWFWGQGVFSKGSVEVVTNGEIVASGLFYGSSSIMQQGPDREFLFYDPSGSVVAVVTQEELGPAISAAIDEAGLGG